MVKMNRQLFLMFHVFISIAAADFSLADSLIIYKYIDANGVLHLTNKPPKSTDKVLYARSYSVPDGKSPFKLKKYRHPKYDDYAPLIEAAAQRADLPPALLHAIVQVESAYNPKAISPKGAVGLMQLMPATAKRYGVTERTDAAANLNGGAQYLRDLLSMFDQELSLALAAYNAGENAVKRYGNTIPPYRETINYVKKVNQLYQQYLAQPDF
jgi:soluble lytic murein transglycosylase-like protein